MYWEPHREAAHQRAAAFTAGVSGLSETQEADTEAWYVEDRIEISRTLVRHLTERLTAVETNHSRRHARAGLPAPAARCAALLRGPPSPRCRVPAAPLPPVPDVLAGGARTPAVPAPSG